MATKDFTYGFMSSSLHRKPMGKQSKEIEDFETDVRAALGLSTTAPKYSESDADECEEGTVGPQTKKALKVKATIEEALEKAASNDEVAQFEREVRSTLEHGLSCHGSR